MRMRTTGFAVALVLLVPAAVAAPPGGVPPGLADTAAYNEDGSVNWPTVGLSVGAAALVAGAAYLLHRRRQPDPVTVQSDADAVLAVLDRHDGQTTQPVIQDALDWSPSKTSRVTSRLADDGAIKKLQFGRENIVKRVDDA